MTGNPRDLKCFTHKALGCQRFLSIDRVANNGLYVEGEFYSEKAGTYRAYFNFVNNSIRIRRLDIGCNNDVLPTLSDIGDADQGFMRLNLSM
jgi:hypothetical protein